MVLTRWKVPAAVVCVLCTAMCYLPALAQQQPVQDSAAVQPAADPDAPFLLEPKTPEEIFAAVVGIVKQARPAAARVYLDKFLESNPDDDLLLKLRRQYGTAEFLKLAQIRELQPASDQLLEQINTAFRRRAEDPAVIDSLIAQFVSGSAREAESAVLALRGGGDVSLPRMIEKLNQAQDATEADRLSALIARMGSLSVGPLLGALDSENEDLRASAITILGTLNDPSVIPFLLSPAFGPNHSAGTAAAAKVALGRLRGVNPSELSDHGVARELERLALAHFRNDLTWQTTDNGEVTYWVWNRAQRTVERRLTTPESASATTGAKFAQQALAMSPDQASLQALFLAFVLANDMRGAGWSVPMPTGPGTAHDLALLAGPDATSAALKLALDQGNQQAAVAALQALAQIASRSVLYSINAQRNPILSSLNYPDPSVQLAAAITILELDPNRPFGGSSRVVQILGRTLNDLGRPVAIVIDADNDRARRMGSHFNDLGYEQVIESTGRGGFQLAASRADIGLIALHLNTIRWPISQTVANIRADARTASIPIVVFGEESDEHRVRSLLTYTPMIAYVPDAQSTDYLQMKLQPFLDQLHGPELTASDRAAQKSQAAFWLAHIARGQREHIFDLRLAESALIQATNDSAILDSVLTTLSAIPTTETQHTLHEIATNTTRPDAVRERSATLLAFHIQRFGLQLSDTELQAVRTAWEQANDPGLATALASVLGTLKPSNSLIRDRLRQFPLPGLQDSAVNP